MVLKLEGKLAITEIGREFFHLPRPATHNLGDFYRGGYAGQDPIYVPDNQYASGVPTHPNPISFSDFYGQEARIDYDDFSDYIVNAPYNAHPYWWAYTYRLNDPYKGEELGGPTREGTRSNWNSLVGKTNKTYFHVSQLDEVAYYFSIPPGRPSRVIVTAANDMIRSDWDEQGYNYPDGSGIQNLGLRLEGADNNLIFFQQGTGGSHMKTGHTPFVMPELNYLVDPNIHGTELSLRWAARIYRNDDDGRIIRHVLSPRNLIVKGV